MNSGLLFRSALRSLYKHKMRTFLTTIGIIIGVVAIIAVMSIGEGAKYRVKQQINSLGSNFMIVLAQPPKQFTQQRGIVAYTLKPSDMQAIIDECPSVDKISPGVQYQAKVVYDGNNWQTSVYGVNEDYFAVRDWKVIAGEIINSQDVRSATKVAIIGRRVVTELFGDKDALGKTIRIKKIPFTVVGILEEKGKTPDGRDFDDAILVPISTAQRKLVGKQNYAVFIMNAVSSDKMDKASAEVRSVLRQRHRLQEEDDDDFTIFTQGDIAKATNAASTVLNLLLMIIASISLIVGGIGIMNIMLVTVTERTKEIGIRMALGATTTNILTQFLLEAVTICMVGGLIGAGLGIGVSEIVSLSLGWPVFISTNALLISLGSTLCIGVFFGYWPAKKAAALNPVQALLEQ